MKKYSLFISLGFFAAFGLWTAAVCLIDVQPIGPLGTAVGFASLNGSVHRFFGIHWALYDLTDLLSLVPLGFAAGFGGLGLSQWIRRKKLTRVDHSILVLGIFYLAVMAAFAFFEIFPVNCRPVLIEGAAEASYPSSTTMLVLCVMPTAVMQLGSRIRNRTIRRCAAAAIALFTAFMVTARLISGVHWLTDIIGGGLLSAGLVMLYHSFSAET